MKTRKHTKHLDTLIENPELFDENPAEVEMLRELNRMGVENDDIPDRCPKCGCPEYNEEGGMVGETMLFCVKCKTCVWVDNEGAIRAVY